MVIIPIEDFPQLPSSSLVSVTPFPILEWSGDQFTNQQNLRKRQSFIKTITENIARIILLKPDIKETEALDRWIEPSKCCKRTAQSEEKKPYRGKYKLKWDVDEFLNLLDPEFIVRYTVESHVFRF